MDPASQSLQDTSPVLDPADMQHLQVMVILLWHRGISVHMPLPEKFIGGAEKYSTKASLTPCPDSFHVPIILHLTDSAPVLPALVDSGSDVNIIPH